MIFAVPAFLPAVLHRSIRGDITGLDLSDVTVYASLVTFHVRPGLRSPEVFYYCVNQIHENQN